MWPFTMPYMKWATSKVQNQFNLTTLSPTESSLTQLYKVDPKLWTCAFIGFTIDADKNNFMFIGNKENKILPTIHKNITPQNIIFQFDLPMYSIPSKNKQKLYLRYQRHCKGVFKHIWHQLLSNLWITYLQCQKLPLRQYQTNNVSLHHTFLPFRNRPSKPVSLNQRSHWNVVLSETKKYVIRRRSTF